MKGGYVMRNEELKRSEDNKPTSDSIKERISQYSRYLKIGAIALVAFVVISIISYVLSQGLA